MVGLDLEAHREREQHGPQQSSGQPVLPTLPFLESLAVCEHERGQSPRQERDSLHLGIVADLNDLEIVGAESHRHCATGRQQGVDP